MLKHSMLYTDVLWYCGRYETFYTNSDNDNEALINDNNNNNMLL